MKSFIKRYSKYIIIAILLLAITIFGGLKIQDTNGDHINTNDNHVNSKISISKNDIKTDYYEDDTMIECTITNNSKKDAERVEVVYYVYNTKGECVYMVSDIFSLKGGENKYTDLSMCDDYSYTEIKVSDVY